MKKNILILLSFIQFIALFSQAQPYFYYGANLSGVGPYRQIAKPYVHPHYSYSDYEINSTSPLPGMEFGIKLINCIKKSKNIFGFGMIYNRTAMDYTEYDYGYDSKTVRESPKAQFNILALEMNDYWAFSLGKRFYLNVGAAVGIRIMNLSLWKYTEKKYIKYDIISSIDKTGEFKINPFYVGINVGLGRDYTIKAEKMYIEINYKQCVTKLMTYPAISQNALTITQGWYIDKKWFK